MKKTHRKKTKFPKLSPTRQLIAAMVLLVISFGLTKSPAVLDWEISIFQSVYNQPDFLHGIFFTITQFGSIHALFILLGIYLFLRHYHVIIRIIMSGTLAYLVSGFAKDIWGRERPNEILLNIVNLDYVVRGPGFPSGHMALATAMAFTIAHYVPRKYSWIIFGLLGAVGYSRVYLGVHFPVDILGGFAIGWASYALFRHVRLYDVRFSKKRRSGKSTSTH